MVSLQAPRSGLKFVEASLKINKPPFYAYGMALVVFDPATVADRASFEAPHQAPAGIGAVVVNGVPVVLNGRPTGATPGRVLRRGRPDAPVAG